MFMQVIALIPAYNPTEHLAPLVRGLAAEAFAAVIVVNDGSEPQYLQYFNEIEEIDKVTVLRHAVNLGKGAALKTGMNHIYCCFENFAGVVVVDADGQHTVGDAVKVADRLKSHPESLIMGVRAFDGSVPLRSRLGNSITCGVFRVLTGRKLSDTQSGLRGIPKTMFPVLLKMSTNGYEFELDMLLACKYTGRSIIEQPIRTVYLEGNKSSHFNPIIDSMRIYFVLLRFTLAALLTTVIDYTVFIFVFNLSASISASQASARLIAMGFNYTAVKRAVFYSEKTVANTFPKYFALVCVSGFVSYLLIKGLSLYTPLPIIAAKVLAESSVFLANFAIQRDFIFVSKNSIRRDDVSGIYQAHDGELHMEKRPAGKI
jgi:glycosyltransferase involved in cell wall biosynthesis